MRRYRQQPRENSISNFPLVPEEPVVVTGNPALAMSPAELKPRSHHERHCTICNHADRDAIEEEFIHWHNPTDIAFDYRLSRNAIYRHAHAMNLFALRERNLRFALGHMIQQAMNTKPTPDSILKAIRAYSCLTLDGRWIEPPAHVVVSSGGRVPSPPAIAVAMASVEVNGAAAQATELPATAHRVESDATH
ncbi:MAG: hypothetical protein LAN36_09580 [Acidobacteriia bacterium]|nr:hypothetical protein [Terriglobia bacterium]